MGDTQGSVRARGEPSSMGGAPQSPLAKHEMDGRWFGHFFFQESDADPSLVLIKLRQADGTEILKGTVGPVC